MILGQDAGDSICSLDEADPSHQAVLAVGPGMGHAKSSGELVDLLLQGDRRIVLDADGLNHLAKTRQARPLPGPDLIMTPHPGEFTRLAKPLGVTADPTDPATRPGGAAQLAQAHRAVVVLKGKNTVVTDGKNLYVNTTGNPALATAGSGDVLTGLIASFTAQGMTPMDAATLGVYLHGLAADAWAKHHGPSGLTARDLADLLPDVMRDNRQTQ